MYTQNPIAYIGVDDIEAPLFESQFPLPHGMAYNSYVLIDDKIAIMDTMEAQHCSEWFANLETALAGRDPDYLIVHHMEPDHSAAVAQCMERYPHLTIVASKLAFDMMEKYFGDGFEERRILVAKDTELDLGHYHLQFFATPMVHWPEVIMSFIPELGALFSADAFGKFGANTQPSDWLFEARRYYFAIVARFGANVQTALKKLSPLDIKTIYPLHGFVLDNPAPQMSAYQTWSSYEPEKSGVTIAFTSVYGHTRRAAELLEKTLQDEGIEVALYDLARCDMTEAITSAFMYDRLVIASTTYNMDVFPVMRDFLERLVERNYTKRLIGIIQNGSWAPVAGKVMKSILEPAKNLTYTNTLVTLEATLNDQSRAELITLAQELTRGTKATL